ncbi:vacuolar protein-sorting-associated protein 36 [Chelonus insularis]|uniref:vacuolar protein-sorting-associated protein 36 n=1 Tax=Chelonus insularis TaxID=460826 RepID=UPI00158843E3|nr:vacuolar protein-sorting-associated protein 36 [Chelonus insularis]
MDRFEYAESRLLPNEIFIRQDPSLRLYDGDTKTNFKDGELVLTSHRIIWGKAEDISSGKVCLSLSLRYVVFFEEESSDSFFSRSKKIILHLSEPPLDKLPGPVHNSIHMYIKLSFKEGLSSSFLPQLTDVIIKRLWETVPLVSTVLTSVGSADTNKSQQRMIKTRTGIIGIERSLQERQKATDESISIAFQDLRKLMEMAKDMVSISKTISTKIRERKGDITEDETVRFKSYLMSMGIDDPVTRDAYKSSNEYFRQLALQLAQILEEPVKEVGGMMTLTDVYCRVNRARGLELLSPEDLLNASKQLALLDLPLILRVFDSGVMVLQLRSHDDNAVIESIAELIRDRGSVTAEELAQSEGISVILARERLLVTEKYGKACRDDTIESLRFYPNLFLEQEM